MLLFYGMVPSCFSITFIEENGFLLFFTTLFSSFLLPLQSSANFSVISIKHFYFSTLMIIFAFSFQFFIFSRSLGLTMFLFTRLWFSLSFSFVAMLCSLITLLPSSFHQGFLLPHILLVFLSVSFAAPTWAFFIYLYSLHSLWITVLNFILIFLLFFSSQTFIFGFHLVLIFSTEQFLRVAVSSQWPPSKLSPEKLSHQW